MAENIQLQPAEAGTKEEPSEAGVEREGRNSKTFGLLKPGSLVPPIWNIITFDNDPCPAASGATGTCYSQKECKNLGGTADGTCANGFGVCCLTSATCDGTVSISGSSFTSPSTPYNMAGVCTATLDPPEGTCQIKLDLTSLNLLGPVEGDCSNDTFVVTGANSDTEIPVICGENGGQHMYIDIDNSDGPYQLIVTTSGESYDREWDVMVTYLGEGDANCAPNRCLQYHTETTGTIESFGYPLMSNNQKYSICFGYVSGYCDVALNFDRFDLGSLTTCTNDFLAIGGEKYCGDFLGYSVVANATGPIVLTVMSDDNGEREEEGFSGSYTMLGC